jgi:hypothetical protein
MFTLYQSLHTVYRLKVSLKFNSSVINVIRKSSKTSVEYQIEKMMGKSCSKVDSE